MEVDEVKPKMKGYGLTVMSGTKPVKFDIEVISTMKNFRPGQSLFIIKTNHPKLKVARTVAGMSGSPIYIDGRMIGAYAYGWFFNVEPIAGVTPIRNMLNDLRAPIPKQLWPTGQQLMASSAKPNKGKGRRQAKLRGKHRFAGSPLQYNLSKHASQVAKGSAAALAPPSGSRLRAATTDILVGGLSSGALRLATKLLEPIGMNVLQTGGGGSSTPAKHDPNARFVDGGVINVQLARGDVSMAGLGTVTHVVGDKLVAFGHPMMNGGIEYLPTALGKVHWVLATYNRSFKIGEPIQNMGTLINDRQASIVVDTKMKAPAFPVDIQVEGALGHPKKNWQVKVAHDQFLAPAISAVTLGSVLETVSGERNAMTWQAESTITVAGYGDIKVEDFGITSRSTIGPSDFARGRLTRTLGALLNNPWGMARIEKVKTKIKIVHARKSIWLRGAELLTPEIDAGDKAMVRLVLEPYHGKRFSKVVAVPISRQMAGKTVRVKLGPAFSQQRPVAPPESLRDLANVLSKLYYPSQALLASYELSEERSAAFAGHVAHRLPQGAANTLASKTQTVSPRIVAAMQHSLIPLKGYVAGNQSFSVKVREVLR